KSPSRMRTGRPPDTAAFRRRAPAREVHSDVRLSRRAPGYVVNQPGAWGCEPPLVPTNVRMKKNSAPEWFILCYTRPGRGKAKEKSHHFSAEERHGRPRRPWVCSAGRPDGVFFLTPGNPHAPQSPVHGPQNPGRPRHEHGGRRPTGAARRDPPPRGG